MRKLVGYPIEKVVSYLNIDDYENLYKTGDKVIQSRIRRGPLAAIGRCTNLSDNLVEVQTQYACPKCKHLYNCVMNCKKGKNFMFRSNIYPITLIKLHVDFGDHAFRPLLLGDTQITHLTITSYTIHALSGVIYPPALKSFEYVNNGPHGNADRIEVPQFPISLTELKLHCSENSFGMAHDGSIMDLQYLENLVLCRTNLPKKHIYPGGIVEIFTIYSVDGSLYKNLKVLEAGYVMKMHDLKKIEVISTQNIRENDFSQTDTEIFEFDRSRSKGTKYVERSNRTSYKNGYIRILPYYTMGHDYFYEIATSAELVLNPTIHPDELEKMIRDVSLGTKIHTIRFTGRIRDGRLDIRSMKIHPTRIECEENWITCGPLQLDYLLCLSVSSMEPGYYIKHLKLTEIQTHYSTIPSYVGFVEFSTHQDVVDEICSTLDMRGTKYKVTIVR